MKGRVHLKIEFFFKAYIITSVKSIFIRKLFLHLIENCSLAMICEKYVVVALKSSIIIVKFITLKITL